MNGAQLHRQAARMARHWGEPKSPPRLVGLRENAVFRLELKDGRHMALRLHRAGYQGVGQIQAELDLMSKLGAAGFACPGPVSPQAAAAGLWVAEGESIASAVEWVFSAPVGKAGQPLAGTRGQQAALFFDLGGLLARFHDAADEIAAHSGMAGYRRLRPTWDESGLLGDAPVWGPFWQNPVLDPAESLLLQKAREKATRALRGYRAEGADFGIIHADALRENVLRGGKGLTLIDYGDFGWGFRLYDLAVAVSQNDDEPHREALQAALLEGYGRLRPLPDDAPAKLHLFGVLRALASCGWAIGRLPPDNPRQKAYAARAVAWAARFLDAGCNGPGPKR